MTKLFKLRKSHLVAILFLIIAFSCEKDENKPDYVGTWVITETVTQGNVTLEVKDIMTFTENTFTDIGQIKNPTNNTWVNYIGMKGTIEIINGTIMSVSITKIGMSAVDMVTGNPTGDIVYYEEGESGFTAIIEEMELNVTFSYEFSISGNKMTMQSDINGDGDYNDEYETTIYTKQ